MPRPDFRKLATERLSTPEPIGMRIGALLGMSAADFAASGFSAPSDVTYAPLSPAPRAANSRRQMFAAAASAALSAPVQQQSSPFLSASSPFLSATAIVAEPVVKQVASAATPKRVVKPKRKTKAKSKTKTTAKVTPKMVPAPKAKRPARRAAAASLLPVELPESLILNSIAAQTTAVMPEVSGPSPVGDLAARTARVTAGVRSRIKTGATDPVLATRETVLAAFGDELSRLVELLGGPDGRPEDEHERAKVRKFLQISRIYLDNLAVRMK